MRVRGQRLPHLGDTKDKVCRLLGKPHRVQGPGTFLLPQLFQIEWVYLNNPNDSHGLDRKTHWVYSVQFGSDGKVVRVAKTPTVGGMEE